MNTVFLGLVAILSAFAADGAQAQILQPHIVGSSDSLATVTMLKAFLQKRGNLLDSVLIAKTFLATVIVRRSAGSHRVMESFTRTDGGFEKVGEDFDIDEFGVVPSVQWFSVDSTKINALLYRFDAAAEGLAQSRVYNNVRGRWTLTYKDPQMTCTAAELRDIGTHKVLVRFTNDVSPSDCEAPCDVYVQDNAGIEPAWAELWVWDRVRWRPSSSPDPGFYKRLAAEYRRAATLVRTQGVTVCGGRANAMAQALDRFAQRANAYAAP